MNKFLTKIATFGLGMIMAIGVGVAAVTSDGFTKVNADSSDGQSSAIVFKSNGSDASKEVSDLTATNLVESNNLVESGSGFSKIYTGKSGAKFGTSSKTGTMTLTINDSCENNVKSIKFVTTKYSSDTGKFKITLNPTQDNFSFSPGTDYTYTPTSPMAVSSLKIETTSKRGYLKSITFEYQVAQETTKYTVSFDANGGTEIMSSVEVVEGTEYTLPTCTFIAPQGKAFSCWLVNGESKKPGDKVTVNADITIIAQWANLYSVEYVAGVNGNNGIHTVSVPEGDYVLLSYGIEGCGFTEKVGFGFKNWLVNGESKQPGDSITIGSNTTIEAQYEEVSEIVDTLNRGLTGATGTSYNDWSGKTSNSTAVYAGNSAGGNESIQLRSSNSNSGVITTASGGKLAKIVIAWNSNTSSGRTIDVYGKNSAYSSASDLYGDNKGTKLGSIVCGTSTELTISGDYTYFGLRSSSSALYITEIKVYWSVEKVNKVEQLVLVNSDIKDNTLEVSSDNQSYKLVKFKGIMTDETEEEIGSDKISAVVANENIVRLGSSSIGAVYGLSAGETSITYTHNDSGASATLNVKVIDDFKTTVNQITFLEDIYLGKENEKIDLTSIIASKVANTYFGKTSDILDSELMFSYSDDRSTAISYDVFTYDFGVGVSDPDDKTLETQTLYMFVSFDTEYKTSFEVIIEEDVSIIELVSLELDPQSFKAGDQFDLGEEAALVTYTVDGIEEIKFISTDNLLFTTSDGEELSKGDTIYKTHAGLVTVTYSEENNDVMQTVSATFELIVEDAEVIELISEVVPGETSWVKVTEESELTNGNYLIVCEGDNEDSHDDDYVFDSSLEPLDANDNFVQFDDADNPNSFNLEFVPTGVKIKTRTNKYIYGGTNKEKNALVTNTTAVYNKVELNSDDTVNIIGSGGNYLRFNSATDQMRFRYFKASTYTAQKAICLYKEVTASAGTVYTNGAEWLISLIDAFRLNSTEEFNICDKESGIYTSEYWDLAKEVYANLGEQKELLNKQDLYGEDGKSYIDTMDKLIAVEPTVNPLKYILSSNINNPETITLIIVSTLVIASAIFAIYYRKREENAR